MGAACSIQEVLPSHFNLQRVRQSSQGGDRKSFVPSKESIAPGLERGEAEGAAPGSALTGDIEPKRQIIREGKAGVGPRFDRTNTSRSNGEEDHQENSHRDAI